MKVTQSAASLGMIYRPSLMLWMRYVLCPLNIVNLCRFELISMYSVDQALDRPDLSPRTRENCLRTLCKICGRHALLPSSLKAPISFERTGDVVYRGGFADVWKGEHRGQDVAVKVIRIYSDSELQRVIGVSDWMRFLYTHLLMMPFAEILQGSCCVEGPPASECSAADRSDNVWDPICNDIRLDGKWEYQQLCEGTS